jgi:CHAT domain-containing protein
VAGREQDSIEAVRAARRELDDVITEIRRVPGHEDFLAAPTFDDVAAVATPDHPVVYLAAAEPGGLALVVRGADVTHVPLESLTAAALRERLQEHLARYEDHRRDPSSGLDTWQRSLDDVTAWLWTDVVGDVLAELKGVERAVFVAGGLLGLLPLHAAWTDAAGARRHALDDLTVTYAPNARGLAVARRLAALPSDRLFAVTDPATHPLAFAAVETQVVAHFFAGAAELPDPAGTTPRRVLDGIAAASVAHLACHGAAQLDAPLESGLVLAGGEVLTLRDILALRSNLRLAVLSACETSMPGTELPDEVVSLPTGLLQAGVGGVVASLWAVPDLSTTLLMTEFYRRWRGAGELPADALRAAQIWLRDTTDDEKTDHLEALADAGELPPGPVETLAGALFERGEGGAHIQAWAGFAYVGA